MRHGGAPVEDILAFPTGGVGVSVGGPILRVWDLNMGKCVRALSNHQKTVTCAAFDGSRGRVLTGGLDMMVKVYDVEDWKVVHTMRYPAPLLTLAVSVSPSFPYLLLIPLLLVHSYQPNTPAIQHGWSVVPR